MFVRQGWTGEVRPGTWHKYDVSVDESDLVRLLIDNGLPGDTYVPFNTAYTLLEGQAERLMLIKLVTRQDYPRDEAVTKINTLNETKTTLLDTLRRPAIE